MPIKSKTITISADILAKELATGLNNYLATLAGFWLHPFLTLNRLLKRTTVITSFLALLSSLIFLWLAQLVRHPQPMGLARRLIVWQELAGLIIFIGLISAFISLIYPRRWRQILSLTFFTPLPALWLVLRSVWIQIKFLTPFNWLINFLFLDLTIFLASLQLIVLYLWLRLIGRRRIISSLAIISAGLGWLYLFKRFVCLWF